MNDINVFLPVEVEEVAMFCGGDLNILVPAIPEEFGNSGDNEKWFQLFNDLFFFGIQNVIAVPVQGVIVNDAMMHIRALLSSDDQKQQEKELRVAYLFSIWFQKFDYEVKK